MGKILRYGEAGHDVHKRAPGSVMTVEFELDGQKFMALNGGPLFKFNEAISLMIDCKTQADIDYYWEKLSEGGDHSAQQCGWLKDKFGLSWQVVPSILPEMVGIPSLISRNARRHAANEEIDIAALQRVRRLAAKNLAFAHSTAPCSSPWDE